MNGHAAVKVGLGGAHLDGHAKALQHLAAAETHDVQADHLLLGTRADQLVRGRALLLGVHHGVVHGREVRLVDGEVLAPVLLDRLRLREADGADLGVREHDRGDVPVVKLRRPELLRPEQPRGQLAASRDRHRGELDLARHIAERVDVLHGGGLVLVHGHEPVGLQRHAGRLQPQTRGRGGAPDSPDEVVHVREDTLAAALLVVDRELARRLVLLDLGGGALLVHVDAEPLVLLGHALLDHGVKVAQEGVVADEQVRLDAERVEHARKLDGDVPGADQGHLLGQGGDVEEAVAVDAVLGAGDRRGGGRVAAGGDEDLLGVDHRLGAVVERHLDRVGRDDLGPAVHVLDLVVGEVALVDAVEAVDVGVALLLEGGPVEGRRLLHAEAVRLGLVEGLGDGGGVEGDFLGDAAGGCQSAVAMGRTEVDEN